MYMQISQENLFINIRAASPLYWIERTFLAKNLGRDHSITTVRQDIVQFCDLILLIMESLSLFKILT
jgi:hypothetical protein